MTYDIKDFDKVLLHAYGAYGTDEVTKSYYWKNLLKVFHGLDRSNLKQANSLMNIFVNSLTFDEKIKFFKLAEQA